MPASKQSPASKSAHDKLRQEFNEFKALIEARLGIDPNAPAPGSETDVARLAYEAAAERAAELEQRAAASEAAIG